MFSPSPQAACRLCDLFKFLIFTERNEKNPVQGDHLVLLPVSDFVSPQTPPLALHTDRRFCLVLHVRAVFFALVMGWTGRPGWG